MHQIIFCTCPDQPTAQTIAEQLIAQKLAACVNILPGITSVYQWQGQIETAQEHLLLIKSASAQYLAIESAIKRLHPYELPEIVAVAMDRALPAYLKWMDTCLASE